MKGKENKDTYSDLLFAKIQQGDTNAYEILFKKHYHSLCTYSRSIIEEAYTEEVVQEVMLSLWENKEKIIIQTSIVQYLYGAVKRQCLSYLRRNQMIRKVHEFLYDNEEPFLNDIDLIHANEISEKIYRSIEELPDSYKNVFKMNRFENYTYKEIAHKLHISVKSVDYKIQQALKLLRKKLHDYI